MFLMNLQRYPILVKIRRLFNRNTLEFFISTDLKGVSINIKTWVPLLKTFLWLFGEPFSILSAVLLEIPLVGQTYNNRTEESRDSEVDVVKLPTPYDQVYFELSGLHGVEHCHAEEWHLLWVFWVVYSWCWRVSVLKPGTHMRSLSVFVSCL